MATTGGLVDTEIAARYVRENLGWKACAESTIRRWAHEGRFQSVGRKGRRKLYRLVDIHKAATGEDLEKASLTN